MGTTVVALVMPRPNQALIAHVGDSRAYLLRKRRLRRLTADHTVVAELVTAGKLTPEQAIDHPHASVLSRNLGGLPTTDVDLLEVELLVGDRLLLCSDGLNGYATRSAIEQVLSGASTPDEATADLIDLAKRGGGGDNISAIVVEVLESNAKTVEAEETGSGAWIVNSRTVAPSTSVVSCHSSFMSAGFLCGRPNQVHLDRKPRAAILCPADKIGCDHGLGNSPAASGACAPPT